VKRRVTRARNADWCGACGSGMRWEGGVLLGGDVGEKTGNAKKEVWWWPLPMPGGGSGDGWTHRETPAHRNGAAVCVKPQTRRERTIRRRRANRQAPRRACGCGHKSLPSRKCDRCNTRHRRGADPACVRRQSSHPARVTLWITAIQADVGGGGAHYGAQRYRHARIRWWP
jgi:hypothetical protein